MKKLYLLFLLLIYFNFSNSQNVFLDEINLLDHQRGNQLIFDTINNSSHSFMIRSASFYHNNFSKGKKNNILKSLMFNYEFQNNSLLPQGENDGLMYPSRGWQERLSIGLNLGWKFLDINFQPEKLIAENSNQEKYYGNVNDGNFMFKYFGMVANNIDHFRRFGFDKIDTLSPGQSRIGFKFSKITIGYSSENIWWGPGRRNSLIFSNNSGGFKHYYLNSLEPIKTNIGNLEFSAIIGSLDTTKYTDIDQELLNVCRPCKIFKNLDQRKIDAITINWRPKWVPNLYIGYAFARQYYANTNNEFGKKYSFFSKDRTEQILGSMMFRFTLPKDHAEFYGEIGLPDEAAYPWKFFAIKYPRTGAIFGFSKYILFNKGIYNLHLNMEFTQLQLMNPRNIFYYGYPFYGGKSNSWYLNTTIKQGWSNNGQLMGSSIGPGSNSQNVSLSFNKGYNKIGLFVERVVHNNDFYFSVYYNPYASNGYGYYNRYWVDLNTKFVLQLMPIKNLLLSAGFLNTNALNYRWIRIEDGSLYDEPSKYSDKFNQQFQLSIKYLLNAINK